MLLETPRPNFPRLPHRNLRIAFVLALGVAIAAPASAQTPTPTATPTATPGGGVVAYWEMDWEGSSASQGIDTNPAYTTETVSGGFGGRTGTGSGIAQKLDAEAGHSSVVHDFTWAWAGESGNSNTQPFATLSSAVNELCGLSMDLTDHTLNVNVSTLVGSDSPVTTASTLYYIRERITDNGNCTYDCSVYIDETPNWGAGGWYTDSIIGQDYPSGPCTATWRDIRGVTFPGSAGNGFDYVVDDSGLCDEVVNGTIPVGTKCGGAGVPTPTATPTVTPTPTPTPEPGVMLQLVSGAVGLAWLNKRRNRSRAAPRRATASGKKRYRPAIGKPGEVPGIEAKNAVFVAGDDELVVSDLRAHRSVAGASEFERVVRCGRSSGAGRGKKRDGCRRDATEVRTANSAATSGCGV